MNFSLTKLQIFLSRDAATKKKSATCNCKNIFYTLLDRRVSADRVHNVDRKNKKSEKRKFLAFVPPQGLEPWTPTLRVSCSTN